MFCITCGAPMKDTDRFCPKCGAGAQAPQPAAAVVMPQPAAFSTPPVQAAPMAPVAAVPQAAVAAPAPQAVAAAPVTAVPAPQAAAQPTAAHASLYSLKCPACGSSEFMVQGVKGSLGKSYATALAFGAIGNLVAGSNASKNTATEPIQYKCTCGNKFEAMPFMAEAGEILPQPCTIQFQRASGFVGAAVPQIVYLNGEKMGPVKNGKTLTFTTHLRYNTLFVTDQHGVAFKDMYRFEAQPQSTLPVRFNRKFMR